MTVDAGVVDRLRQLADRAVAVEVIVGTDDLRRLLDDRDDLLDRVAALTAETGRYKAAIEAAVESLDAVRSMQPPRTVDEKLASLRHWLAALAVDVGLPASPEQDKQPTREERPMTRFDGQFDDALHRAMVDDGILAPPGPVSGVSVPEEGR